MLLFVPVGINPLLKPERDTGGLTLIPQGPYPVIIHRSRARTGFRPDDDPVQIGKPRREIQRCQQRLARHKADRRWRRHQERDPLIGPPLVFDGDAEPEIGRRPAETVRAQEGSRRIEHPRPHPGGSLGQDLKDVTRRALNGGEHLGQKGVGHLIVEQVTHAVDKNPTRLAPVQRLRHPKVIPSHVFGRMRGGPRSRGPAEAVAQPFGITVLTPRRDLGAPGDRVPGRIGPVNA